MCGGELVLTGASGGSVLESSNGLCNADPGLIQFHILWLNIASPVSAGTPSVTGSLPGLFAFLTPGICVSSDGETLVFQCHETSQQPATTVLRRVHAAAYGLQCRSSGECLPRQVCHQQAHRSCRHAQNGIEVRAVWSSIP